MKLHDYIEAAPGRGAFLATALKAPAASISNWKSGARPVPDAQCIAIERATGGEVTCEELRPNGVPWNRIPDPEWPHPLGRPVIDPARPAEAPDAESAAPEPTTTGAA